MEEQTIGRRCGLALLALCLLTVSPASGAELASGVLKSYRDRVDTAIEQGLAYLASIQTPEGFFPDTRGQTTAIVSLAGMAFLAKGHTPGYGEYGEAINLCIDYVMRCQRDNGMLIHSSHGGQGSNGGMYSHNIAALFLSEVSGMVDAERQEQLDDVLSKAVRLTLQAQRMQKSEMHRGGWRYNWNSRDSDLSCSGWALMSLRSARMNGAPVPDQAIEDAVRYILRNHDERTGKFGYQNPDSHHVTLTGAALLCLELTGHHGDETTKRAGSHILNVHEQLPHQSHCFYGVYYAAQGTFQLGGKYWERFGSWMYDYYLPRQHEDGSWEGRYGRSYATSMMVLAFAVPYRQLPIYQRDETVEEE